MPAHPGPTPEVETLYHRAMAADDEFAATLRRNHGARATDERYSFDRCADCERAAQSARDAFNRYSGAVREMRRNPA